MDVGDKFKGFMQSFAAAVELRARADKTGSFVESVVLTAALIDAMLRIGLVLKHQLDTGTEGLLPELLHQGYSDQAIVERKVYTRALEASVIGQELYDELNELYDDRNRVVHRYVISSITTSDVLAIAVRYEAAEQRVTAAVGHLEEQQVCIEVGMTRSGGPIDVAEVLEFAASKHGDPGLAQALREEK